MKSQKATDLPKLSHFPGIRPIPKIALPQPNSKRRHSPHIRNSLVQPGPATIQRAAHGTARNVLSHHKTPLPHSRALRKSQHSQNEAVDSKIDGGDRTQQT
uniref:Uncharacterized protein n=1 Tax=Caenorhabditis japonica TaxID=281687 RepID=A0A8R1IQ89_CAEJA